MTRRLEVGRSSGRVPSDQGNSTPLEHHCLRVIGLYVALGCFAGDANAGWFGPTNFADCVLDSMKGVSSDLAAQAIAQSCRAKFPVATNRPANRPLTEAELKNVRAQAAFGDFHYFNGTIYNGNASVTITKVVFVLTTTVDGRRTTRDYASDVLIRPLAAGAFGTVIVNDEFVDYPAPRDTWTLKSAEGY